MSKDLKLKIEYIPIENIHPSESNAKLHPPKQIRRLRGSIEKYGFITPLILDKTNTIVAGHGRYLAAQDLKLLELPCVYLEHLTPKQADELRIIDNKLAETGYDEEKLLLAIKEFDIDFFEMAGIDPAILDPIHAEMAKYNNANCEYPLVPKFSESYHGFIIVAENDIDRAFMENALGCEISKSYKTKAIGRSYVITAEKFKKLWEKNKGIAK